MKKNYQTKTNRARNGRVTPRKPSADEAALRLPDAVTVSIADLAGELREGLLAFVVHGHRKVRTYGHEKSALVAMRSPQC